MSLLGLWRHSPSGTHRQLESSLWRITSLCPCLLVSDMARLTTSQASISGGLHEKSPVCCKNVYTLRPVIATFLFCLLTSLQVPQRAEQNRVCVGGLHRSQAGAGFYAGVTSAVQPTFR